jgi:hypothetical protein
MTTDNAARQAATRDPAEVVGSSGESTSSDQQTEEQRDEKDSRPEAPRAPVSPEHCADVENTHDPAAEHGSWGARGLLAPATPR